MSPIPSSPKGAVAPARHAAADVVRACGAVAGADRERIVKAVHGSRGRAVADGLVSELAEVVATPPEDPAS
jgi:hypothetical protein